MNLSTHVLSLTQEITRKQMDPDVYVRFYEVNISLSLYHKYHPLVTLRGNVPILFNAVCEHTLSEAAKTFFFSVRGV